MYVIMLHKINIKIKTDEQTIAWMELDWRY